MKSYNKIYNSSPVQTANNAPYVTYGAFFVSARTKRGQIKLLFSLFFLSLSSCISPLVDESISSIDPELEPYYSLFIEEGKLRGQDYSGHDVVMYFGDVGDKLGVTVERLDHIIEIIISRKNWERFDSEALKCVTVFHELGHGFLKRGHEYSCESIMSQGNKYYCKYYMFYQNRSKMIDELFSK